MSIAGEGPVDVTVPGLAIGSDEPPDADQLEGALSGADLVLVENIGSLPLNPRASDAVARALGRRRAIFHHHDLAWQRPHLGSDRPPADDPAWVHVTINRLSVAELASRGITATVVYNHFDTTGRSGDRAAGRAALGIGASELLVLQPTRAIPRKNVRRGLALAESLGATYWLTGPDEDGYGAELERILAASTTRVVCGRADDHGISVADAYAACDAVVLPSTWEGFGNPAIESALHRRPLAIGEYPVAAELADFGFRWFPAADARQLARWLEAPDDELLQHNHSVASESFDLARLPSRIERLFEEAGWEW